MAMANDNRIEENLSQSTQQFLSQPPEWYIESEKRMDEKFSRIESSTKEIFNRLEHKIDQLENIIGSAAQEVTKRFNILEAKSNYTSAYTNNLYGRVHGLPVLKVPFLNREVSNEGLPLIKSVEDIDKLSREQCETYLRGYDVHFRSNEKIKLKEKLRDAIGLVTSHDRYYPFRGFNE